jgi:hypothetical protein
VVTLLVEPPLGLVVLVVLVVVSALEADELPLELDELAFDVPALAVFRAARAGSCPLTSTTAISNQVATNSAQAPPTTRRRIVRTRNARALRIAAPRSRAASRATSPPASRAVSRHGSRPAGSFEPPGPRPGMFGVSGVMFDPQFRFGVMSNVP